MRFTRTTAIAGLAIVSALAGTAAHAGADVDRATGGGQILLSTSGHGPGDTIAFTAQGTADDATGKVNVIDRVQDSTGQGVHFRGDVECVIADGNTAKIAGHGVNDDGTTTGFTLVVVDNGEGAAADNDTIAIQYTNDPTCDREDGDDDSETDLARGNAQVYDAS